MPSSNRPRPPDGINPGRESRLQQSLWWVSVVLMVMFLMWPLVALSVLGPGVGIALLMGPAAVVIFTSVSLQYWLARRSRSEVLAADFCICLECRYPLGALPPQGICPECGEAYDHDKVRQCWRWTLDEQSRQTSEMT
jgi:hypothetical protein